MSSLFSQIHYRMTALLTITLLIFFSLFFYVVARFGFISSWSEMYYKLEKQGWIFQVVMVFLGMASGALMFQLSEGHWFQFVGLFAAFPICFVGVAPRFRIKQPNMYVKSIELEREVHFFNAKLSGAGSIIWIVLMAIYVNPILALSIPIASLICYIAYKLTGSEIWWIEMVGFWSVFMVFSFLIY